MTGSDAVIGGLPGGAVKAYAISGYSEADVRPTTRFSIGSASSANGGSLIKFSRSSGDGAVPVSMAGSNSIIWAFSSDQSPALANHGGNYGQASVDFSCTGPLAAGIEAACCRGDAAGRRGGRTEAGAQRGRAIRARAGGAGEPWSGEGEQRREVGDAEGCVAELRGEADTEGSSAMGGAMSAGRGSGEWDVEHAEDRPVLCFPGGGMFFYWQMGAAAVVSRHGAVDSARLVGASAGALAATLTACGVDATAAARAAFDLSLANGVWDRPAGLAGVWGRLVGEWLDLMLPADAHTRCTHRLSLHIVTLPSIRHRAPWFQRQVVSQFASRADLIACCLASVHIPFFMDGRPWTLYRGRRCVDGSILAMPEHLAPASASSLFLDFALDE
ncbi:unnamed protein product, partial [Closterium sp. Naga37s-1]